MEKKISKNVYTWVGCFLLGRFGVGRFLRGQIGIGILKILFGWGLWDLIDWIIALTKLSKYDKEFVFKDGKWA